MRKLAYSVLVILACIYITPLVFTLSHSVMDLKQITEGGFQFIPRAFNLSQYFKLSIFNGDFFALFKNSAILSLSIIIGQLVIGIPAAYILAKYPNRYVNIIFAGYVLLLIIPFEASFGPVLVYMKKLEQLLSIQILDTHILLILMGAVSPIGVFLLRLFIKQIPNDMLHAARMEGIGEVRVLYQFIVPNIKPAIFTLSFLLFIDQWNMIEQAVVFLESPAKMPLSVSLQSIFYQQPDIFYSASTIYLLPGILLFFALDKQINKGLGGLLNNDI